MSLSQGSCFYVVIPWEHFICPRAAAFKKLSATFSSKQIFKEGPSTHIHTHTQIFLHLCVYICVDLVWWVGRERGRGEKAKKDPL